MSASDFLLLCLSSFLQPSFDGFFMTSSGLSTVYIVWQKTILLTSAKHTL